jgi:hydrogenase nickel incorporation protein HypB
MLMTGRRLIRGCLICRLLKPLKYPTIFNTSDVAIITKMDLAEAAEFDVAAARRNIESVRPGMQIFEVSSKTGHGMQAVFDLLHAQLASGRQSQAAVIR